MQEFESISASSYDPSALATKLTAKAAEGWSVVAIVPTGGDVTAFVTRDTNGANESKATTEANVEAAEAAPTLPATPEPEAKQAAVSEPSGWAIAPEPVSTAPDTTGSQPAIVIDPTPSYQPTSSYQPAAATPTAVTPAAAAPAAAPEPAAPAVPAGWYADPAGRFELRYWDGSTWTEHVSRAGQQFTDPPVA
jgi:hypothetical protein